jgi:uncharacterized protein (TIRG00374 family)
LAAGLTGWLLWKIHPRDVLAAAAGARWAPIAVAVLLVLVDRALMAYRWVALLCTIDHHRRPPLAAVMRVFFESTFVGTFLPSNVASDALRSYGILKLQVSGGDAVASVFMDRMLGVASVLLMALLGLALARDLATNTGILLPVGITSGLCLLTLLLVFSHRTGRLASAVVARLPVARVRHVGMSILDAVRKYVDYPRELVNVLACSIVVQALRILQAYCLGQAIGITAPLSAYFAFIPLILLAMLLPITPNGIGTGQLAFVWFFARAGVPQAAALALSILFIGLGVVGNLPGAVLYAMGPSRGMGSGQTPKGLTQT